jgi:hypothetical protein
MLSCRHCLQDVMCWAAIQELKERGGLRTWLFLSSGNNKAEILFRRCRVRCGEIRCVLNIRLCQAVPSSFSQNDNGFFDSALSADAYHVAIYNTLRRSLVTPRCGHSSSCAIFIHGVHVATRGSCSVNFSLTTWFKSKICLHLAVCVG